MSEKHCVECGKLIATYDYYLISANIYCRECGKKQIEKATAPAPEAPKSEEMSQLAVSTGPKEIGVLFDIDELGSAFYGLVAWKIFLKNCDPQRLCSSVLLHGDTRETLQGGARHFCIAVRAPDLGTIAYVKEIFTNSKDKGLSPLDQRFIQGRVTSVTGGCQPLPIWGRVDAHGRFVTEKYNPYDEQACEYAGWTYAPLNLSQLVHDSFIFGKDQKIFAAKKVAQYRDLQALAVLKKHLETEKDEDVRRVCEEALDKITPQQVPAAPPIVSARPTPEEVKSPPKKYCTYCGSEMLGEGMYCPSCGKRQVEDEIKGTKEAEAAAKLQKPARMGFLDRLRGKPDVKSLRERGDVEELVKALSHEDWHVRKEAAEALGELGDRRAVPALIGALEDKMPGASRAALGALAKIKDPDSVESLSRILQDPRWLGWSLFVVEVLGAIGGPDSVKALKSALEHKDWDVHREAVKVLERIRWTSTDPSINADISAALEKAKKDRIEYRKLDILEALKSVESYRMNVDDLLLFRGTRVRWPNCCCFCLGPAEVRQTVSGGGEQFSWKKGTKSTYKRVSVEGVPYCKFCQEEARVLGSWQWDAKTGADVAIGVEIEVDEDKVTFVFKNPEYGKIFAQANRFPY